MAATDLPTPADPLPEPRCLGCGGTFRTFGADVAPVLCTMTVSGEVVVACLDCMMALIRREAERDAGRH